MRRAARRDLNEPALIAVARGCGALMVKAGPLDYWCWSPAKRAWVAVEVKNPRGRNRLTPRQREFIAVCAHRGALVWVWNKTADVLACLNARVAA